MGFCSPCSGQHSGQRYRYIADLQALDSCRAPQFLLPSSRFATVVTSLKGDRWQRALQDHPDQGFVTYIVEGINSGFRVGFRRGSVQCISAKRNMPSASQCVQQIDEFLGSECAAGRILGPFDSTTVPTLHSNQLKAVPKKTQGNTA